MFKKLLLVSTLLVAIPFAALAQTESAETVVQAINAIADNNLDLKSQPATGNNFVDVIAQNEIVTPDVGVAKNNKSEGKLVYLDTKANNRADSLQLLNETFKAGTVTAPQRKGVRPALKANASLEPGTTFYAVEFDYSFTSGERSTSGIVDLVIKDGTAAELHNLWGVTDTLQATIDIEAGTVSITPAIIYTSATYGEAWAAPFDPNTYSYSTSSPITGSLADDGTVILDPWGVFVVEGAYSGGTFGYYSKSEFKLANGTFTDINYNGSDLTYTDSIATYPVYIDQTYDNQVDIINFSNVNALVKMRLRSDSTTVITPQTIYTSTYYGNFNCMPADWANSSVGQKGNIIGTGAPGEITLPNWGIFCASSTSLTLRRVISSTLKYDDGAIVYPQPTQQDWTGEGTESNPYVITTTTQFTAFSEQVEQGEDFKGKYVALGADIDFSTSTSAYIPVGSSTAPFRGTFDGKGYTIKNFNISTGAEDYQGIFGYADTTSVIKNLNVTDATLTAGGMYNGVVAGASAGVIKDITLTDATITYSQAIGGGVVGYFNGSELSNIEARATITGVGSNGIVAGEVASNAQASNLVAHGSISVSTIFNTSYVAVGGVIGATRRVSSNVPSVVDCYSDATIAATAYYARVGGVVGGMYAGTLERSFNTGNLSAAATYSTSTTGTINYYGSLGGVTGLVYGADVKNCYNAGALINSGSSTRVGGIFAYIMNPTTVTSAGKTTYLFESTVENCYNSGYVYSPVTYENQGLFGTIYNDTIVKNIYYDRQLVGTLVPEQYADYELETAELTSGSLPAGFDASIWTATAGLYPRLQGLDENPAARLSASPVTFSEGEDVNKVKTTFKISTANNIRWKVYENSTFSDSSTGLTINGDEVSLKNAYSTELLAALSSEDNSILKMVRIKTVNPSVFEGQGTEDNPYLIRNKADLINLDEAISTYYQTFRNDYFKQVNDIDIAGATDFQGIGRGGLSSRQLDGTYDGDGHKISGLAINGIVNDEEGKASSSLSQTAVAFFGFLGENGVVKNLTIDSDCDFQAYNYASGVVAVNYGKVQNCKNFAPVTVAAGYVGGIVSINQAGAEVSDCYNAGTITTGGNYAAGIAGACAGDVLYCQNDGIVLGDSINPLRAGGAQYAVAGITAYNITGTRIVGCINAGPVYASYNVGGITTALTSGEFTGNINYGTVDREQSTQANRGAMFSTAPGSSVTVENNYYDVQIASYGAAASASYNGLNGVNTSALTSGEALEGLDATKYDLTAGLYPVLKAFKDEEAVVAHRKMVVTFANGQSNDDMLTDAALYQADDLQWTVAEGTKFTITNGTLTVNIGDELTSVRDTLTAVVGNYNKVLPLRAMPVLFDGAGTEDDPFQIKTKDDMLKLATFTNTELYPFTSKYFKVLNDIDFGETTYECVGINAGSFNGIFDADGKSFYNIVNECENVSTNTGRGMFGNLGEQGVIRNLILASGTIKSYRGTGAIVGVTYGRVENCENHAQVTGTSTNNSGGAGIAGTVKIGGVVTNCRNYGNIAAPGGQDAGIAWTIEAGGRVEYCTNEAEISLSKTSLAGIAVYNAGVVDNCVNNGAISGTSTLGGIVVTARGGDSISNCVNHGAIVGTGSNIGGILSVNTTESEVPTVVTNCYNDATVSGKGNMGGLAGRFYSGIHMTDCYNTAAVTSSSGTYVGGLVGYVTADDGYTTLIERCYNTANVTTAGNYAGGVFGRLSDGAIANECYNTGDIYTTRNYAGGIAGSLVGEAYDCYNTGNVTADGYGVGGVAGIGGGTAVRVFNLGDVYGGGNYTSGVAGGLWGYGSFSATDSYNMGTVTGGAYVGGITGGASTASTTIVNCYNAGAVVCTDESLGGNICPSRSNDVTISNTFFDNEVGTVYGSNVDAKAVGQTTRQLSLNAINDSAYSVIPGMYPTLQAQADNELANFFAAIPVLAEGETALTVASAITIGVPEGTSWTASDNFYIQDGKAYGTAIGEAWLTKTYGERQVTYNFTIITPSGIDDVNVPTASVVSTRYYGINGAVLGSDKPSTTGVYIEVSTLSDGSTIARKLQVK